MNFIDYSNSSACRDSRWGRRASDGSREPGNGIELISETQARQLLELHDVPVEFLFEREAG
jgi:hypothetical protein